jgi:hypothetical protein
MPQLLDAPSELLVLEAEMTMISEARNALPAGAHIHGLFMLVLERIEDRVFTLKKKASVGPSTPRLNAAA